MEAKIDRIIAGYDSDKGFLIPILQDVQKEFNYLPRQALDLVGSRLSLPISRIFEVATFYKAFHLEPRGRHQISLCQGTACHVRGVPLIVDHVERSLGIESGQTTADLEFTFETVNCLGACALGPVMVVNGEYHGKMTLSKMDRLLKKLEKKSRSHETN
ncbi:MAG: NAD(P)H-dependent oxidoreductase subunit E [Proteobacteria bacterium]|nr:NAD(P)H-dependent oxidoreductase subunit E [Pseudomonadota bacterium]